MIETINWRLFTLMQISLAFSLASWRMKFTICFIWRSASDAFILTRRSWLDYSIHNKVHTAQVLLFSGRIRRSKWFYLYITEDCVFLPLLFQYIAPVFTRSFLVTDTISRYCETKKVALTQGVATARGRLSALALHKHGRRQPCINAQHVRGEDKEGSRT